MEIVHALVIYNQSVNLLVLIRPKQLVCRGETVHLLVSIGPEQPVCGGETVHLLVSIGPEQPVGGGETVHLCPAWPRRLRGNPLRPGNISLVSRVVVD